MKLIITKDYEDLSNTVADIIQDKIEQDAKLKLVLPTGSTPIGLYAELVKRYKNNEIDFKEVTSFNLDEYVGLDRNNENSYYYFMHDSLFNHINIKPENTYLPNGMAEDIAAELLSYEKKMEAVGGIDLLIDGLGENGHIGFNEPNNELQLRANVTPLTTSTIEANSRFFENKEEVPTEALTLGMGNIMEAKEIIIIVNGEHKAEAVQKLINSSVVTTQNPSTLLHLHPNVTVVVDEAAAKLL